MTTIRDLYEWAIEDGVEDLPIGLQFQDEDNSYCGNTFTEFPDYCISAFVKEYFGERYILLE